MCYLYDIQYNAKETPYRIPGAGVHLKIILEQTEETDEPAYQKQSHLDE